MSRHHVHFDGNGRPLSFPHADENVNDELKSIFYNIDLNKRTKMYMKKTGAKILAFELVGKTASARS